MDDLPTLQATDTSLTLAQTRLFSPIRLRGMTARNRIVVSPMCQYASVDGGPTDYHLVHLGRFAMGGAGIVIFEDSVVEARGRTTTHCAGLYDDALVPRYRRITDFVRSMGAVPGIQIGHTGRAACTKGPLDLFAPLDAEDAARGITPWQPVAPSPAETTPSGIPAHALDEAEIAALVQAYADATRRAVDAGFDLIEIHGGHGYLISQFLSATANRRTDRYGGSLENRMRFPLEAVEAVRAIWPADRPLFFRVSAVEGKGGSWGMSDTIAFGRELLARGIDVIDCSSGGIGGKSAMPAVPRVPGFQTGYAMTLRETLCCATMAVGGITTGRQAESILADGAADLVAVATEFMLDPNWPVRAARDLGAGDFYDLLPEQHAFRVRRRDAHLKNYPQGSTVWMPTEVDQAVVYDWVKQR